MTNWLTIEEVAERLRVSKRTVERKIKEKVLTAYKPAGRYVIDEKDLEKFVRSCRAS